MAGGRRPSSYVSGARHSSGIDRQHVQEALTSPPLASATGPSLPPWIPSIWQPAPVQTPSQRVPREKHASVDPSSVLAAALDTAVQSAVERALGGAAGAAISTSQLTASSSNSDNGTEDETSQPLSQRETELHDLVAALRTKLHQRDQDVSSLQNRMDNLEKSLQQQEALSQTHIQHSKTFIRERLSETRWELDNNVQAYIVPMKKKIEAAEKLVCSQKNYNQDVSHLYACSRLINSNFANFRSYVSGEFEKYTAKMKHHEQSFKNISEKLASIVSDAASSNPDIEQVRRSVEAATESLAGVRSKLKKIETQLGEVSKQAEDSIALGSAFEESIRAGLDEITENVSSLYCTVTEIKKALPSDDTGSCNQPSSELTSKVDSLETNLKALKRLIESNLRTQWSAESIVKEQVSLITKHVCVAMRQYTARRISENNALIDKALRARIPEYAKNDDQFVLVREEDLEGNESVGIHRSQQDSSQTES